MLFYLFVWNLINIGLFMSKYWVTGYKPRNLRIKLV